MNHTQDSFEKFTKRKTHEPGSLPSRKGWKKHSYSSLRGLKRKCED